jgi:SAM-dependent methyltransferase
MSTAPSMTWEEAVLWLRRQPDAVELVRACFYDDPLSAAAERYWQCSEWQAVRQFLPTSPCTALDIGSGRGISAYALARDGHTVTALEPNPSDIVGAGAIRQLAHATGRAIDVAETWGEALPFSSASFDVVHCRQVLHHARDLGQLCSQIGRVLKPSGTFIATREHVISRKEDLPAFLDSHPLHRYYGGEHAYLLREYTDAIEGAGLKLSDVLNPFESPINCFPATRQELKARLARKLRLPFPQLIPDAALTLAGRLINTPGRLFTFIARKPAHE